MHEPVTHHYRILNSEGFARGESLVHSLHPKAHEFRNVPEAFADTPADDFVPRGAHVVYRCLVRV